MRRNNCEVKIAGIAKFHPFRLMRIEPKWKNSVVEQDSASYSDPQVKIAIHGSANNR